MSSRDETQQKAFLRWTNLVLSKHPSKPEPATDLIDSIKDGVTLGKLAEIVIPTTLRLKEPVKNDLERTQNVTLVLDAFQANGVKLINIHSSAIVRGDKKTILGMLFQLCIRYQVVGHQDANTEHGKKTLTVTELKTALIVWINVQLQSLKPEHNLAIRALTSDLYSEEALVCTDLEKSLIDGAVLIGLIASLNIPHSTATIQAITDEIDTIVSNPTYTKELLTQNNPNFDFSKLSTKQIHEIITSTIAMKSACEILKIPQLMDAEDMVLNPDSNAALAYYSYYKNFNVEELDRSAPPISKKLLDPHSLSKDLSITDSLTIPELPPNVVTITTFDPKKEYDDDVIFYL